jgi:hypothetical protein
VTGAEGRDRGERATGLALSAKGDQVSGIPDVRSWGYKINIYFIVREYVFPSYSLSSVAITAGAGNLPVFVRVVATSVLVPIPEES